MVVVLVEVGLVFVRRGWVADVTLRCVEGKVEAGHYEGGCLGTQRLQTPDMVEVETVSSVEVGSRCQAKDDAVVGWDCETASGGAKEKLQRRRARQDALRRSGECMQRRKKEQICMRVQQKWARSRSRTSDNWHGCWRAICRIKGSRWEADATMRYMRCVNDEKDQRVQRTRSSEAVNEECSLLR